MVSPQDRSNSVHPDSSLGVHKRAIPLWRVFKKNAREKLDVISGVQKEFIGYMNIGIHIYLQTKMLKIFTTHMETCMH